MYIDSHAHYDDEKFENDREEIIEQVKSEIGIIIDAGYNLESSKFAVELAKTHENIYATVGISPNDVEDFSEENLELIEKLAKEEKVLAIGEIGLDYYWNKENKELQIELFKRQINLANKLDLPIVIHCRDAIQDTLNILKNEEVCKNAGVFHCCPLNRELIKEALKLGYYISFAGPITFKNSKNAEEIVKMVPLERILTETDSPYLTPEPLRGTRNNSKNVKYITEKIAQYKNLSVEEVNNQIYLNLKTIYRKVWADDSACPKSDK